MSPEITAVAGLFILRLGVPILMVLGGGYLAGRYVQAKIERNKQAEAKRIAAIAAAQAEKEERWRKAA